MTEMLAQVLHLADSSSEGDGTVLIFILPVVVGIGMYWLVHNYYRNSNARFKYEEHIHAEVHDLKTTDVRVQSRRGLKSSTISGRNEQDANANIPLTKLWPEPRIPDANNPQTQQAVPPLGQPPGQAVPPLGMPPGQATPPMGAPPQQAAPPAGPPVSPPVQALPPQQAPATPPYQPPAQQPPYQPPAS
ncbi:hypothetical protein SAMN06309944_1111 [Micrococcales bacterium KH10]|nr:hypothetical protein SAMN06309944_1111 [Micrococcales bacterium KH10]